MKLQLLTGGSESRGLGEGQEVVLARSIGSYPARTRGTIVGVFFRETGWVEVSEEELLPADRLGLLPVRPEDIRPWTQPLRHVNTSDRP